MKVESLFTVCHKCNGRGIIDAYSHVAHGICFKCGGDGRLFGHKPLVICEQPFFIEQMEKRAKACAELGYVEIDEWIEGFESDLLTIVAQIQEKSKQYKVTETSIDPNFDFFAILDS